MCASWTIPATAQRTNIVVALLVQDEISIAQDQHVIIVAREQLSALADKLYFLDQAFRSNARDVVEGLCE